MINSKLEDLFSSIENSNLYKEYKKMGDILDKDKNIRKLLEEIKDLEKEATYLEYIGDLRYLDLDEKIREKSEILNANPIYQEYLNKMDDLNDELAVSSKMIESYVENKV